MPGAKHGPEMAMASTAGASRARARLSRLQGSEVQGLVLADLPFLSLRPARWAGRMAGPRGAGCETPARPVLRSALLQLLRGKVCSSR